MMEPVTPSETKWTVIPRRRRRSYGSTDETERTVRSDRRSKDKNRLEREFAGRRETKRMLASRHHAISNSRSGVRGDSECGIVDHDARQSCMDRESWTMRAWKRMRIMHSKLV